MFDRKTVAVILAVGFFVISSVFAQSLDDDWNDFLHYTKIGRFDLAKGHAKAVLDSNPEPLALLALSEKNPQGYAVLLKVIESAPDAELAELSGKILDIVEQGRFIRRADPKTIAEEIKRLNSSDRGRLAAVKRLQNAGEYAVMYMLDAMVDDSRKDEFANIVWALPQIGRDSIRPLAAALQSQDVAVKAEVIRALGKIGYPQALAYLKYVVEKDDSPELRELAIQSIKDIDIAALQMSAAQLFYNLAENYYYHAESLAPVEKSDSANMWFWNPGERRLVLEKVDSRYFNELMSMRVCEWALKADAGFGQAIGLWLAAYSKAEAVGIGMPGYFGPGHADAGVYATTAGPEYLYQALARAIKDEDAHVALSVIEALGKTGGEKSLLYRLGSSQPLVQALSFNDKAVRYSASIAVAEAGPKEAFAESKYVIENLAEALGQNSDDSYSIRSAEAMLKLAQTQNPVIDLAVAQEALIIATKDGREEIQVIASQVLARLSSPVAQRSLAELALSGDSSLDTKLVAFDSLAISARLNGNLLDDEKIDAIYSLVSSGEIDPQLRSAAAVAFGSLNLPSQKVKNLILDQARS